MQDINRELFYYLTDSTRFKNLIDKGASPNAVDDYGYSILSHAVDAESKECVELLLMAGVNPNDFSKTSYEPMTLLLDCTKWGGKSKNRIGIIRLLIKYGADVNTVYQYDGYTPLMYAVSRKLAVPVVQDLLKAGAEVNVVGNDGKSVLDIAEETYNFKIIELLKEHGAIKSGDRKTTEKIKLHTENINSTRPVKDDPNEVSKVYFENRKIYNEAEQELKDDELEINHSDNVPVTCIDGAVCSTLVLSKSENILVGLAPNEPIIVYSINDCKELKRINPAGSLCWWYNVAVSDDEKYLASGYKSAYVWSTTDWKKLGTFKAHKDEIQTVVFSNDSKYLATGSIDFTVALFELPNEKPIYKFRGHKAAIIALAFSEDSKTLFSLDLDHVCKSWDTSTGMLIDSIQIDMEVRPTAGNIVVISDNAIIDPTGSRVYSYIYNHLYIWELKTGKILYEYYPSISLNRFAVTDNGRTIYIIGDKGFEMWKPDSSEYTEFNNVPSGKGIVISNSNELYISTTDNRIMMMSL